MVDALTFTGRAGVRALRLPDPVPVARVPLLGRCAAALHGALPVPAHPCSLGEAWKYSRPCPASTGLHLSRTSTGWLPSIEFGSTNCRGRVWSWMIVGCSLSSYVAK